jgi:hypothetical protein
VLPADVMLTALPQIVGDAGGMGNYIADRTAPDSHANCARRSRSH